MSPTEDKIIHLISTFQRTNFKCKKTVVEPIYREASKFYEKCIIAYDFKDLDHIFLESPGP